MNIALFSDSFIPTKSGIVTVVIQLKDQLRAMGHQVSIVTVATNMESEEDDPDIFRIPSRPLGLGTDQYAARPHLKEIVEFLKPRNIEIVHCHTEFFVGHAGVKAAKALGIPVICTTHTMWEDFYSFYLPMGRLIPVDLIRRWLRHFFRKFDALINVSTKARNYFKQGFMVPAIPSAVIPNAIDKSKFHGTSLSRTERQSMRDSLGIAPDDIVLLFVGRIGEEKRVFELLKICIEVLKQRRNVYGLFVGSGPALPQMKKTAADSEVSDRILFTGFIEWKNVHKYYQISQIFITASLSEMHSMTILEASILGLPIVARKDESYMDTVLEGKNGFLADTDKQMTKKIVMLVDDGGMRTAFGKLGRILSGKFTIENHAKKTIAFYQAVISSYPKTPSEDSLREVVELVN